MKTEIRFSEAIDATKKKKKKETISTKFRAASIVRTSHNLSKTLDDIARSTNKIDN